MSQNGGKPIKKSPHVGGRCQQKRLRVESSRPRVWRAARVRQTGARSRWLEVSHSLSEHSFKKQFPLSASSFPLQAHAGMLVKCQTIHAECTNGISKKEIPEKLCVNQTGPLPGFQAFVYLFRDDQKQRKLFLCVLLLVGLKHKVCFSFRDPNHDYLQMNVFICGGDTGCSEEQKRFIQTWVLTLPLDILKWRTQDPPTTTGHILRNW